MGFIFLFEMKGKNNESLLSNIINYLCMVD